MLFLAGGPKLLWCVCPPVGLKSHNITALTLSGTVKEHGVYER